MRPQIKEVIVFSKHYKIDSPYPSNSVNRKLPNTFRKLVASFFSHVKPLWYVLLNVMKNYMAIE